MKIENICIYGIYPAILGVRNSYKSQDKSDSERQVCLIKSSKGGEYGPYFPYSNKGHCSGGALSMQSFFFVKSIVYPLIIAKKQLYLLSE